MSEGSQLVVPASFVALFVTPGRSRPAEPPAHIAGRHELCEDLACLLTDEARRIQWDLGVTEDDVLQRVHRGLLGDAAVVSAAEAQWVVCRLAELLGWPLPAACGAAPD